MAAGLSAETLLGPADRVRHVFYRWLAPWAGPWLARREPRVAALGTALVLLAFAGSLVVPLWLLALGPIVLGVPHIVSDVRYLVVRPGYHARWALAIAAGVPLAVGAISGDVVWAPIAAAGALAVARGASSQRALGVLLAIPVAALCVRFAGYAELAFAHAHNLIAVALWWGYRERKTALHAIPLALFAVLMLALLSGVAAPTFALTGPAGASSLRAHLASLAPFATPELGVRYVIAFAFAQSVHYAVWLRLVPEEDRAREAPRSFASSWRALRADLSTVPLATAGTLAIGLATWALFDLAAARTGYLRCAVFHGQLEVVAAALLWAEGRSARCN